jgi:DNA repair exonuclease SbcCD nuclease subunit
MMTTKVQITSDLHLEFAQNFIEVVSHKALKPTGDILLLAGDIFNYCSRPVFNQFIDAYKDDFEKIVVIGGNHEWYNSKYQKGIIPSNEGKLVYLHDEVFVHNNIRIIGSTMWSGASYESSRFLNDYFKIGDFNVNSENAIHEEAKDFITEELAKDFDGKTIVMTHHLPLWECVSDQYKGSPMNDCFASNQDLIIRNYDIDLWIHGHSHDFQDITIHDTRIVRNPLGYGGYGHEWKDWKPDFTIEM